MVQEGLSAAEECLCLASTCERFTAMSSQNYITPQLVLGYESQKSITPLQYFKWHQSLYVLIFRTGISARPCLYSCIFQKFSFIIFKLIECCATVHLCVCINTRVFLCFIVVCTCVWRVVWGPDVRDHQMRALAKVYTSTTPECQAGGSSVLSCPFCIPRTYYFTLVHPEGVFVLWLWWGWRQ